MSSLIVNFCKGNFELFDNIIFKKKNKPRKVCSLYNKSKSGSAFSGDTRGFDLGADTLIDGVYTLGAGFAYNNTEVSSGTRDTEIDSQTLFLYGQYKPSKWFLNTTLAYTMAEHTENAYPFGVVVESTYDSTAFGAQMKLGYDFATGLTPEIGGADADIVNFSIVSAILSSY